MAELPGGTVTLLFTDIEGSTQLLRRLGDAYAGVLAEHQRLLREAFTAYGGQEVDTQGDAFFVAFPRAADAVQAAVSAQRALTEHPWPEGGAVRVRMGLHTGEPAAAGGRYVGLAVHRAARVGAVAHGGQVLVSETTRAVLRDQLPAELALRELGEHRLKGFEQPERLYQLVIPGLPAEFPPLKASDPAPLPPLPVPLAADEAPLVGRERELGLLRERLGAALAGRGGLVLIGGEAGVGKTTLAEALAREALDRGARVALGRCYDLTETPPYGPWREALAAIPAAPDLPPLPAALGGQVRGEAVASREALFARAHAFLAAAAAGRPLMLLLDDLHWADPASLDLLRFLARQLPALPLLLVITYRADELTRRHPLYQLLPLLAREARATRLDLRALPEDAVRDLVRGRYALPEADERRLAAYLSERAEGHPLFVGELLRTLEEEGALRLSGAGWSLGDLGGVRVPRLLRQVIEGRLDRLGEGDQRLLGVAAVIGQEVPLDLWATVSEANDEALVDLTERAAGARLVEPTGEGLRFAHALIREALYEGILPPRRRAWHRQAGEALAALPGPDPDAVADHLRRAGDPRAVDWLVRASLRAEAVGALLGAADRLAAAEALLQHDPTRAGWRGWLLYRLATQVRLSDPRRGLAYLDEAGRLAEEAGNPALALLVRAERGFAHFQLGAYDAAEAALAAAIAGYDRLPGEAWAAASADGGFLMPRWGLPVDTVEPARAATIMIESRRDLLVLLWARLGRYAEALALGRGRLPPGAAGADVPPPATVSNLLLGLGHAHAGLGHPEEALALFRQAARGLAAVRNHFVAATALADVLLQVALPYRADRLAERRQLAAEMVAQQRAATELGVSATPGEALRHALDLLEGDWAAAARGALVLRAGPPTRPWWPAEGGTTLSALARHRGEPAAAWAHVRELLPAGPDTAPGEQLYRYAVEAQRLAAALALDAGDLASARAWLAAHDRWLAWSGAVLGQAEGQLVWAAYHRAAGDHALAREHTERALADATEPRQPLALLATHRLLGELATEAGRHAEAQAHLHQALALAEACAVPYERALTLLALAGLHHATGDAKAARVALDEARDTLARLEAKPALARADALAGKLVTDQPAMPGEPPRGYRVGLTAREVEVLRLVAEGLPDAQIAERLFVSRHTVNAHLRSIYGKLGVSSRSAATRFALEHGLN